MLRIGSIVAMILASSAGTAQAQSDEAVYARIEELHGNASGLDHPLRSLVEAMQSGDAQTVADLAEYPLTVNANGESYDILEPADLVDNFEALILDETRTAIARQQYADLFVNSDGVMLADGAAWFSLICDDSACSQSHWAVIAINN